MVGFLAGDLSTGSELAEEYERTMNILPALPERWFNRLKAEHQFKRILSKHISEYPVTPVWFLTGKIRWSGFVEAFRDCKRNKKVIDLENLGKPVDAECLALAYMAAKENVISAGFANEVDWQEHVSVEEIDEQTFLREAAWVVLCSGFREAIVREYFRDISAAFYDWESAGRIVLHRDECRRAALKIFRNVRKIDAILGVADRVSDLGADGIREKVSERGVKFLEEMPCIGPVTACHLAKNLGVPMVKPDRHLVRVSLKAGYESPEQMCRTISEMVGDPLAVIDIVIWRNSTIHGKWL